MGKHFVVTISREFGAEGHEIGKVLSERLGVKLYDKELLARAATRNGVDVSSVSSYDETVEKRFMEPYLGVGRSSQEDVLFRQEAQIIRDLYAKESCIIIGRLSDYILHGEPDALSVFIYAPEEFRINNIMNKHHITAKDAKKLVRKMDAARDNYYHFYSMGKWNHKKKKDMILNRETFGVEGCADILEAMIKTKTKIGGAEA